MTKLKVAILYGGRSVEHGVSINSARNIFEFIDKEKFEPIPVGITPDGTWYQGAHIDKNIANGKELSIRLNTQQPEWIRADGTRFKVDVVFPVLHGTDGEDGGIQGLFKALDIPIVGTGVAGSSTAINKLTTKKILLQAGLPVADFKFQFFDDPSYTFEEIKDSFGSPFMVKAANLGSSVGISKVSSQAEFEKALAEAFRYDDCVIHEQFVKAREIECGVIGNYPKVQATFPGEVIINPAYEFYTFDAKYVDDKAVKIEIPAKIPTLTAEKIRTLSIKAFNALQCQDFARVDLFLTTDGQILINEINTIPGFTNSSMFPMMWKERGVGFQELISRLITFALERYQKTKRIERGFSSQLKY